MAAFRHQGQPLGDNPVRRKPRQVLPLEVDPAAFYLHQAGQGPQGGGFAGAVGADQGHNLALLHLEGNAFDGLDAAVTHTQIINSQHRRPPPDKRQ